MNNMKNPKDFTPGQLIRSIYTGHIYTVIDPGLKGLAKLRTQAGGIQTWNAFNNAHFVLFDGQFKIF
ncbi:MAG: hypothetical protein ACLFQE_08365 [Thermotogota bacterium]